MRIVAQRKDRLPLSGVGHIGLPTRTCPDPRGDLAKAKAIAMPLHGVEPGAFDKLVQTRGTGSPRLGCRIEGGFDFGLRQQEIEIDRRPSRGIGNRGLNRRCRIRSRDLARRAGQSWSGCRVDCNCVLITHIAPIELLLVCVAAPDGRCQQG